MPRNHRQGRPNMNNTAKKHHPVTSLVIHDRTNINPDASSVSLFDSLILENFKYDLESNMSATQFKKRPYCCPARKPAFYNILALCTEIEKFKEKTWQTKNDILEYADVVAKKMFFGNNNNVIIRVEFLDVKKMRKLIRVLKTHINECRNHDKKI
ncbi:MAG: hypothetical protein HQL64_06685 [Magnetococcales bacterium]|nr:hypothetical protein [Magnetococcales bacterium]